MDFIKKAIELIDKKHPSQANSAAFLAPKTEIAALMRDFALEAYKGFNKPNLFRTSPQLLEAIKYAANIMELEDINNEVVKNASKYSKEELEELDNAIISAARALAKRDSNNLKNLVS